MRAVLIIVVLISALAPREPSRDPLHVSTVAELEEALSGPRHDAVIQLAPGVYALNPASTVDSTCGDCANPDKLIPITVGLTISGRNLRIEGPAGGHATILTRAGYGLYIKDCIDCEIERLHIAKGLRDTSAVATNAAIVVTRSSVRIANCVIRDNVGAPAIVAKNTVGIMGICVREVADVTIEQCEIVANSWDGIAVYRDGRATIRNNVIDGDDVANAYANVAHGAAIAVRSNGSAFIERNWIRNYRSGIRGFADAEVIAEGNIVERMATWGINVSDAGDGRPRAKIMRNVVFNCGGCGIAVARFVPYAKDEPHGRVSDNIIVRTRQDPKYDSFQCALAPSAVPEGFTIRGNTFYDTRHVSPEDNKQDVPDERFWRERRGWTRTYRNTGVGIDGRVKFHQSAYLTEYPRWWD